MSEIRHLHIADNIAVLRNLRSTSVDLIYLDPPFNSGKEWGNPIKGKGKKAQGGFKDTWTLGDIHIDEAHELGYHCPAAMEVVDALHRVNGNSWRAYLIYMGVRLVEMRRVLKPTGSIYYHCDSVMSHGVKLIMDAIFGNENFRNEIVWLRANKPKYSAKGYGAFSDHILFYSVDKERMVFNRPKTDLSDEMLAKNFPLVEKETGDRYYVRSLSINRKNGERAAPLEFCGKSYHTPHGWQWSQKKVNENLHRIVAKNGKLYFKQYASGKDINNVWADILSIGSSKKESTEYPTQKPLELLERIIKASSNAGDLVLDPFCGCATALVAAELLGRQWIGIDLGGLAEGFLVNRIRKDIGNSLWLEHELNPKGGLYVRDDLPKLDKKTARANLYKLQGGQCLGCGKPKEMEDMDLDHIIPKVRGGQDEFRNEQMLCRACNSQKGGKPQMAWQREVMRRRLEEDTAAENERWREKRRKMNIWGIE